MRIAALTRAGRFAVAALVLLAFAACHGKVSRSDIAAANSGPVPTSFDVTVLADKDGQFDYEGAPLTSEDMRSALRYRKEESLPANTILIKRGEKQKVTSAHVVSLARIAKELDMRAYVDEGDGIKEILTLGADSPKEQEGK